MRRVGGDCIEKFKVQSFRAFINKKIGIKSLSLGQDFIVTL
jgi:hypothetical protein